MFDIPSLAVSPPVSLEDALGQARRLLAAGGIPDAEVCVTQPPAAGEALRGGCMEVSIPLQSLENTLHRRIEALAAAQGVKVSGTRIQIENGGAGGLSLTLSVEVDVRVFGATTTLKVRCLADAEDGESIALRNPQLDAGSGLFSGMASAMIRPYLEGAAGKKIELSRLTGVPVRVLRLECSTEKPGALQIGGQFV
jgi:hypothetical protein